MDNLPLNNTDDDEIVIKRPDPAEWDFDPKTGEVIGLRRAFVMSKEQFKDLYGTK